MKNILSLILVLMLPLISTAQVRLPEQEKRVDGLSGMVGAGAFLQDHPDKFFSTFNGDNTINLPQLYISEQKFLGNTLRLGRNSGFYFIQIRSRRLC